MFELIYAFYVNWLFVFEFLLWHRQNDIHLSNEQLDILYHYLNEFWEVILYGNREKVFLDMKKRFDEDTFLKMQKLFEEYFNRYKDLL